jgi:hypothetical protein
MALPNNVLQAVQTYQPGLNAYLLNSFALVNLSNKKFQNFQDKEANLGDTVTWDLPPRFTTTNSLVAVFQNSEQRVQSLTCSESANVAYAFSAQQFLFNVKEYMEKFGKSAVLELGTKVETDIANKNILGKTYRFYGDGVTAINSIGQLATMLSYFDNYGSAKNAKRVIIPDVNVPGIVNTMLNQFVVDDNKKLRMSWDLGRYADADFYKSNLLPIQYAGLIGNGNTTAKKQLTVVSTNDPTGLNITQITCTCDASFSGNTGVINANDLGYFVDQTSSALNVRYLTFIGHQVSANQVQIRATAGADASGTTVVLNISPGLCSQPTQNQNINKNIVAGMKIQMIPDHRAGMVWSGDSLFLAMPRLPEEIPFPTANKADPESGVSIRAYYGSLFGQNQRGFVNDCIWGSTLQSENAMRICFPLNP